MGSDFKFVVPPEAPTFHPTLKDFEDPLAYINRIRPVAEKYGICKIKPPPEWRVVFNYIINKQGFNPYMFKYFMSRLKNPTTAKSVCDWSPPFAVDVDKFKFTPRVQKINELEAITRIKLNFLDQISKFWELQGTSLRIPVFGSKALDLYTLHHLVHTTEFKTSKYAEEKKWNMVATRMGLQNVAKTGISVGSQLKAHYEKILYPYDVWKSIQGKKKADTPKKGVKGKAGRMGGKSAATRFDPLANYICQNCKGGEDEDKMLLCDGCDDSYHTFCLEPALEDVPKGEWRCPDCLEEKLSKPIDGFGFEQAQKEYTLQTFGEMADNFKNEYFNMPVHLVSTSMVEKEFWRIVSAIDEDVTVEYGADLHTMDHGSGFPTVPQKKKDCDEMYIGSGWNLNKLPVLNGSVFAHINADISGMKVPWMYVGMCFSTFCWHNEDHWSYSINYLHWGEPKTWYGVPGEKADDFENAMKSAAPELFAQAPDLLHQLVTIMNPNILMNANVPVYRMDQRAGEFIITFPRAYHAGFNQGYNFAEAVNFAPADWVHMGRECVQHYSKLNRFCVFSHDELVCAMASQPEKLDTAIALATYHDIVKMFEAEKEQRKDVHSWGVKSSELVEFEHLTDEGRQCNVCKTTLFLSAISCVHGKGPMKEERKDIKLVCLRHYDQYGCKECKKDPEKHIMKYRYSIDDLQNMISGLKERVGGYEEWVRDLTIGLSTTVKSRKISLEQLREFVEKARKHDYPESELLTTARQILEEAERVQKIAKELIGTPAVRTRKGGATDVKFKCNMDELESLAREMDHLRVTLTEKVHCVALHDKARQLQDKTNQLLYSHTASIDDMANCIQEANSLDVGFEEFHCLKSKLEREKWLRLANSDDDEGSVWTMDYLKKIIEEGNDIRRNEEAERKMDELIQLAERAANWEIKANRILNGRPGEKFELKLVKSVISAAKDIPVALPSLPGLREIVTKTKNWEDKVKQFEPPNVPFLDDITSLLETGLAIPIYLDHTMALESQMLAANTWREECMKVFLKRNSHVELFEALTPRRSIPEVPQRGKKRRLMVDGPSLTFVANVLGIPPPDVKNEPLLTAAYRKNVTMEISSIKALRKLNIEKDLPENRAESKFCVCQKPKENSFMIRCELCLEWFHPTCVPLPRIAPSDDALDPLDEGIDSQAMIAYKIAHRETKYLGPCCSRSRRPEYGVILKLLVGLKDLPLYMVEGVALQCLTQRAMKWQEECDTMLQIPEVKGAYENIKARTYFMSIYLSKKSAEGEDEVDASTQKIFFDEKLSFSPGEHHDEVEDFKINGDRKESPSKSTDNSSRDKEVDVAMILAGMLDKEVVRPEITYQTVLGEGKPEVGIENRGVKAESSSSPIVGGLPRFHLKPELIQQIEDLLIEADLMELTADESDILWKIYDMAKPTAYERRDLMEVQRLIREEISSKGLNPFDKRGGSRKRKSSTGEESRSRKSPKKGRLPMSSTKSYANQECDEDCAAPKCKQPVGKEVTWVQCDGCDQWFHLTCVGLKKRQLNTIKDYTCVVCTAKKLEVQGCDVEDGSSCDTDSKLSSSGKLSISSNKENTNGANSSHSDPEFKADCEESEITDLQDDEMDPIRNASNSLSVFSKVN